MAHHALPGGVLAQPDGLAIARWAALLNVPGIAELEAAIARLAAAAHAIDESAVLLGSTPFALLVRPDASTSLLRITGGPFTTGSSSPLEIGALASDGLVYAFAHARYLGEALLCPPLHFTALLIATPAGRWMTAQPMDSTVDGDASFWASSGRSATRGYP